MNDLFSLEGKAFLVTGASSGIGKQTAIAVSRLGGRLVIAGRNEEKLRETYNELDNKSQHIMAAIDFLNEKASVSNWITALVNDNKIVFDGFVHCAGISMIKPLRVLDYKDMEEVMNINLYSGIMLIRSMAKPKISRPGSSFVLISSVAGMMGETGSLAYSASKAALINAAKTAALELARFKYRVNCVAPGMVDTPMLKHYSETLGNEQFEMLKRQFPLGIGEPSDIANAIIFLLSDASKWITGTTLVVDGGYTCGK